MSEQQTHGTEADAVGAPVEQELGQALEDAAYDCMSALAGVDTYDVNLRDHPQAWAAIEAFAAKVKAAERERCAKLGLLLCELIEHEAAGDFSNLIPAALLERWQQACDEHIQGPNAELTGRRRVGALPARRSIDSERFAGKVASRWRSG